MPEPPAIDEAALRRSAMVAELEQRRRVGDDMATLLLGVCACNPDMPDTRRLAEDLVAKWKAIKPEG